ncbi:DNA-3-methyladenine glycosylase family protein [Nocardia alni]|uniref:DNA-3-methyladenine glycosylase family protein n=1 Tax=Nocardia alni TaxID=2815723 RepID=UPI001C249979|nr:hypothetical protein [Nocardia alni]
MTAASFTPRGPFSLAASTRFLEGFTPASYDHPADDVLRLAFPADDNQHVVGCAVRQGEGADAAVTADFTLRTDQDAPAESQQTQRIGPDDPAHPPHRTDADRRETVHAQIARILSLDIDGAGFPAVGDRDEVVASLQADYPGLRPVCFYSPYEAAAWTIIGNRIRTTQAAAIKAGLARDHGRAVEVAGRTLYAFPTPAVLRNLAHIPGLTDIKIERLHALADATLAGDLDAAALRAQDPGHALRALQKLPGIGPFSADLILIRGAGHPDVFPVAEPRVHQAMAAEYGLDATTAENPARLAAIAENWSPYRSWVSLLLRVRMQDRASG